MNETMRNLEAMEAEIGVDVSRDLAALKADASVAEFLAEGMDVRLQLFEDGGWAIHTGDASYDTDHTGFWGAGTLAADTIPEHLAADLVDQAMDHAAEMLS